MPSSGFCRSSGPQSQNKRKRKDKQIIGSYQRAEKTVEYHGDGDTNCRWCTWKSPQRLVKETRGMVNRSKNQDLDYSIVKIGKNTEKSPGDPRRFSITQTPVKDQKLKLVWKTCIEWKWYFGVINIVSNCIHDISFGVSLFFIVSFCFILLCCVLVCFLFCFVLPKMVV